MIYTLHFVFLLLDLSPGVVADHPPPPTRLERQAGPGQRVGQARWSDRPRSHLSRLLTFLPTNWTWTSREHILYRSQTIRNKTTYIYIFHWSPELCESLEKYFAHPQLVAGSCVWWCNRSVTSWSHVQLEQSLPANNRETTNISSSLEKATTWWKETFHFWPDLC